MLGAAQLGLLAACIVLLLPMLLAGWHLSRNKMLFFSGALFITLAVAVHLAPYFPLLLLPSPSPASPTPSPSSCLHSLSISPSSFSFPPSPCRLRPLSPPDASLLLNASRILLAGDSQARLLTLSLLKLLLPPSALPPVQSALFRRHSDYHILIQDSNITVDFVWAPYVTNLTHTLVNARFADVLVMGSGLWHMLHYNNATSYGEELAGVRRASEGLRGEAVHMFWLGMPALVRESLNTEEKRERMGEAVWEAYERGLGRSKVLRGEGGPMMLLDIGSLSRRCGGPCTEDGMHYGEVVYEAALHIMLNALLIESHQRI